MADAPTLKMWADHEAKEDLLGFGHLAEAVVGIVTSDDLLPATVGVFGDWGGGKSTLLKMVSDALSGREGVLVLQFNGWLFEGYDDAKAALMETIIEEIVAKQRLGPAAKKIALKLARRVNWFRLAGKALKYGSAFAVGGPAGVGIVAGLDAAAIAAKAGDKLEGLNDEALDKLIADEQATTLRRGIRDFREEFSTLLKESSVTRLVVIIDDLDRCLPSTIIETLEAIKLFLFADNTAFILGADERLVKYAVRLRFPELPGENAEVGRDYLEKLIQFPVRVPALSRAEMTNYIGHLFTGSCELAEDKRAALRERARAGTTAQLGELFDFQKAAAEIGGCPPHVGEQLALAERLGPILATGLSGNPRQCKRFLNTLVLRLRMAAARAVKVEARVLAKLMLLEYFKPASFRRLAELQASADGKPTILRELEAALPKSAANGRPVTGGAAAGKSLDTAQRAGSSRTATPPAAMEVERDVDDGNGDEADEEAADEAPRDTMDEGGPQIADWVDDPWIKAWVAMAPPLADVDLRPYFYFSRDTLNPISSAAQRLTPRAQEVLDQLVHASGRRPTKRDQGGEGPQRRRCRRGLRRAHRPHAPRRKPGS